MVCLVCQLYGVQERDWCNDWKTPELPGAEHMPSVEVDEIENYDISVTYALDGGRFGDQLTNYARALWISWKYHLPFLFRPFDYSDQLVLSDFHQTVLNAESLSSFSAKFGYFYFLELEKTAQVFRILEKKKAKAKKLLWNIGMLTPFIEEHYCEKLDDEEFRAVLQKLVKPKNKLELVQLPSGIKTVAIHVRTGVGYDWELNIKNMPTKFPPETFYLTGLKQAAIYFKDQPLYVYIFTDHPDPASIEARFKQELKKLNFDCRRAGNHHSQNVLEDMFSMAQFDCIIHPDSSLSRFAAILTAPVLEIKPSHWGEYRKNADGTPMLDKQGHVIIDPLVVERIERGGPICHMHVAPVEF
jgi:hypothetical protein